MVTEINAPKANNHVFMVYKFMLKSCVIIPSVAYSNVKCDSTDQN